MNTENSISTLGKHGLGIAAPTPEDATTKKKAKRDGASTVPATSAASAGLAAVTTTAGLGGMAAAAAANGSSALSVGSTRQMTSTLSVRVLGPATVAVAAGRSISVRVRVREPTITASLSSRNRNRILARAPPTHPTNVILTPSKATNVGAFSLLQSLRSPDQYLDFGVGAAEASPATNVAAAAASRPRRDYGMNANNVVDGKRSRKTKKQSLAESPLAGCDGEDEEEEENLYSPIPYALRKTTGEDDGDEEHQPDGGGADGGGEKETAPASSKPRSNPKKKEVRASVLQPPIPQESTATVNIMGNLRSMMGPAFSTTLSTAPAAMKLYQATKEDLVTPSECKGLTASGIAREANLKRVVLLGHSGLWKDGNGIHMDVFIKDMKNVEYCDGNTCAASLLFSPMLGQCGLCEDESLCTHIWCEVCKGSFQMGAHGRLKRKLFDDHVAGRDHRRNLEYGSGEAGDFGLAETDVEMTVMALDLTSRKPLVDEWDEIEPFRVDGEIEPFSFYCKLCGSGVRQARKMFGLNGFPGCVEKHLKSKKHIKLVKDKLETES